MPRPTRAIPRPPAIRPADLDRLPADGTVDVVVLSSKSGGARCRLLAGGDGLTARVPDPGLLVPGEIATLHVEKSWRMGAWPFVRATIEASRLDLDAVDLPPLLVIPRGQWDPEAEPLVPEGEAVPDWLQPILARGTRPEYEMEQVLTGLDPDNAESDPILRACDLANAGSSAAGHDLLMDVLAVDLRCIDAHAHLGNFLFVRRPDRALRHYRVGVALGDRALGPGFSGLVPWLFPDNRPFLRSLHGYGLALWRTGRAPQARRVFERLLWLNPGDNQGARTLLDDLKAGRAWEDVFSEASEDEDGVVED